MTKCRLPELNKIDLTIQGDENPSYRIFYSLENNTPKVYLIQNIQIIDDDIKWQPILPSHPQYSSILQLFLNQLPLSGGQSMLNFFINVIEWVLFDLCYDFIGGFIRNATTSTKTNSQDQRVDEIYEYRAVKYLSLRKQNYSLLTVYKQCHFGIPKLYTVPLSVFLKYLQELNILNH